MKNVIGKGKLRKYFSISLKALKEASKVINKKKSKEAEIILDMADRYLKDAKYFMEKGDYVNAFAAINYAHGWLDTGSRLGIFKVKNSDIFVIS